MSTTTVTGTGRRSSIRQPNWQPPANVSSPQSINSPLDKFPPFIDESSDTIADLGNQRTSQSGKNESNDAWQPRKLAGHVSWEPIGISKHRPHKSISEAITTIRTRNVSVSANAHEIAEALKAPVSYRLIVSGNIRASYKMGLSYSSESRVFV
jgi:solute carrier family 35 protein E1